MADNKKEGDIGIASIERAFLRLTFWQTLLSLAGVFTGAVALYAALNESEAVRDQTAAAVWPYVQYMIEDSDDGTTGHFALRLQNVGVGPARMQSVAFALDGEALPSWEAVTERLVEEPLQVGVDFGRSSISRRVLAPGESIVAFQTTHRPLVRRLQEVVYGELAELRYCYCSIFDQCWEKVSSTSVGDEDTQGSDHCPDYGDRAFRD